MDNWVRVAQAERTVQRSCGQNQSLNYSFNQKEVSVAEEVAVRGKREGDLRLGF